MLTLFLQHPIAAIGYLLLILAIFSIWIYPKIWMWGPLLITSGVFAYFGSVLDPMGLIPLVIVGAAYYLASKNISGFARLFIVMTAAIITIGIYTHFVKGFHNLLIVANWQASSDAQPINIYANYDKAIVGLLILGLYFHKPIQSKKELYSLLAKTLPWMLLSALVLLPLSQFLEMVRVDLKFPLITPTWIILQIFFAVIPEEAFYRGFLQREIALRLNNPMAGPFAILIVSLLFALTHLLFVPQLTFVIAAFVASLLYGTIYQLTGRIEGAILTHLFVNLCHFFFFTYPVLANIS